MSNHDGSYLINQILFLLNDHEVFQFFGKEKTLQFLKRIREIGCEHDCNAGEILEEIGEQLKICYCCWEYADSLENEMCGKCCNEVYI
jgi:hypothetical protein